MFNDKSVPLIQNPLIFKVSDVFFYFILAFENFKLK